MTWIAVLFFYRFVARRPRGIRMSGKQGAQDRFYQPIVSDRMPRSMNHDTRSPSAFTPPADAASPQNETPTISSAPRLPHATSTLSGKRTRLGPYTPLGGRPRLGGRTLAFAGLLFAALPVRGGLDTAPPGDQSTATQAPASTLSRQARLARLEARRAYWRERIAEARRRLESWYQRRLVRITEIRNIASARKDQDALERLAGLEAKLEAIHRRRTELLDGAAARLDD